MEKTPKISKKSLSLGKRFHSKRYSVSPQTRMHRKVTLEEPAISIKSKEAATQRSPSAISISFDCGIELTPPNKKFSFDDSLDYSPHTLDSSFSPSVMFSQTLAIDSPEVGWKWNRGRFENKDKDCIVTPDSAYTADSSCTSVESSSTEALSTARTPSDMHRQRKKLLENRREEHRKAMQIEQRKAEKVKMDELLKKRYVKLQEQLKDVQRDSLNDKEFSKPISEPSGAAENEAKLENNLPTADELTRSAKALKPLHNVNSVSIHDFLNDSDSDGLLLEATQQLESQIVDLTEESAVLRSDKNKSAEICSRDSAFSRTGGVTTPKSSYKEKRSSFYSKFLEDDSTDDWFVALDDVALQDTIKPRTHFQRYKSMPIETTKATTAITSKSSICIKESIAALNSILNKNITTSAGVTKGLKRHASSHAFSPSSTSSTDSIESHLSECQEILVKLVETKHRNTNKNYLDLGFRSGRRNFYTC